MAKAAAATARGSKRRAASDADATPSSGKKAKKNAKKSKSSAKKRSDGDAHGWRPLPVRLDFGSAFTRHLFVRVPSANAAEGAAEGTALFVAAIPLGWTRAHLRELFEENFGAVEETSLVTLDAAPDVAGGLVRFASASGAKKALAASVRGGDALDPPASLAPTSIGLEKWVGHHRHARPGSEALGRRIDEWFEAFEAEEARKEAAAKAAGEGDDGWTVVEAKRGRRKTTDDEGTAVGGIRAATADARRTAGPTPRENFYRFQQREKRRGELFELKQKFEVDKERVAKLKASRKFRPL